MTDHPTEDAHYQRHTEDPELCAPSLVYLERQADGSPGDIAGVIMFESIDGMKVLRSPDETAEAEPLYEVHVQAGGFDHMTFVGSREDCTGWVVDVGSRIHARQHLVEHQRHHHGGGLGDVIGAVVARMSGGEEVATECPACHQRSESMAPDELAKWMEAHAAECPAIGRGPRTN